MPITRQFIEWLSFHPSASDIARALVTEYLIPQGPCCARFSRLNPDDSLTFIGEYGYPENLEGQSFPSSEWRSWRGDASKIAFQLTPGNWNDAGTMCLIPLRDRGAVHGYARLDFSKPVADKEAAYESFADLCVPIAIYLSGEKLINNHGPARTNAPVSDNLPDNSGQLTARQILILSGMVDGKTNHEMASEMGFSVSTIRHETMRIYQALVVSDRKEAAKKAITLNLL
jgi:DNA-binding CsgD family transcriptional regulator